MDNKNEYRLWLHNLDYTNKGIVQTVSKGGYKILLESSEILKYSQYFKDVLLLFDYDRLRSCENVEVFLTREELNRLKEFIEANKIEDAGQVLVYIIANMSWAEGFARMKDNPDHLDGVAYFRELKPLIPKLIDFIESYISSNTTKYRNENSDFYVQSISFKTFKNGTISFKHPEIVNTIIKTFITSALGLSDLEYADLSNNNWKRQLYEKIRYMDADEEKSVFREKSVLALRNFIISENILPEEKEGSMSNSMAKLITDILQLAAFTNDGKEYDYTNVNSWYKNSLSHPHDTYFFYSREK